MPFPTRADLEFFQSRQRLPGWTSRIAVKSGDRAHQATRVAQHAKIDDVVNAHAGARDTSGEVAAHNLLVIVQSYQRRKVDLAKELQKLAKDPGCAINPEKRAAFARKWSNRLARTS